LLEDGVLTGENHQPDTIHWQA